MKNYRRINNKQWQDIRNNYNFSHDQFVGSKFGKEHYYMQKSTIEKRFNIFKSNYDISRFSQKQIHDDLVCYSKSTLPDLSDKKVLVVGGGPTTSTVNWQAIDFDYKIASNNFVKNESLYNIKFDMVGLAPVVDFSSNNKLLHDYLNQHNPVIGIEPEHSKPEEVKNLKDFLLNREDDCLIYATKYCSAIGIGSRQVVLSSILGAKEVFLVGLDLNPPGPEKMKHSYESMKTKPSWHLRYGQKFQERQAVIFWDYLSILSQNLGTKFYNLGEGQELNFMSFASNYFSPLTQEIKEKLV